MNVIANMTDILVLPAVLELINAQPEKVGMTKLQDVRQRQLFSWGSASDVRRGIPTYTAVPMYMTHFVHRYETSVGRSAITSS